MALSVLTLPKQHNLTILEIAEKPTGHRIAVSRSITHATPVLAYCPPAFKSNGGRNMSIFLKTISMYLLVAAEIILYIEKDGRTLQTVSGEGITRWQHRAISSRSGRVSWLALLQTWNSKSVFSRGDQLLQSTLTTLNILANRKGFS